MGDAAFESLLKRMEQIAKAVNAFTSETVQSQVFAALIGALQESSAPSTTDVKQKGRSPDNSVASNDGGELREKRQKRKDTATASKLELIKELDLRPKGKKSFAEFVAEKQPSTNEDKFAVVVYYLEQIVELGAISESHISTVFRMSHWREPKNLRAALGMAAGRKATIDTSDRNDIKTMPHGRNFVEHDLPSSDAAK